jgi:hypothetical protein
MTDGAGAQLQRIYGAYAVSRLLGASYLHTPLSHVSYQGLAAWERNRNDPEFHHEFNQLFWIESDVVPRDEFRTVEVENLTVEILDDLATASERADTDGGMCLVKLMLPYGIADRFPDCYDVCKEISPFAADPRQGRPLRVAIHVRQGDLFVLESHRMLPAAYYLNVAQRVAGVFGALEIDYRMELHTEVPTREFVVTPEHDNIKGRISAPVVLRPEMSLLDEFNVLPHLTHFINDRPIDCIRKLATADVLVMSRSSFSYLSAILNRNGIVLYHPFWHNAPSSWIPVGPSGDFDPLVLEKVAQAL